MQTSSLNDFLSVTVACVLERILGTMLNSGAWDLGRTLLQRWNGNYGELIIACNVAEGDKLNYKNKNKGGKFLKKLWCCVGGSITR